MRQSCSRKVTCAAIKAREYRSLERWEGGMAENPGIGKRWQDYRPSKSLWFWSCVACVVATMVVGFHWGGWVTGGTADDMAQSAGKKARAELAASLCVNRFESSADATTQLAALKKT